MQKQESEAFLKDGVDHITLSENAEQDAKEHFDISMIPEDFFNLLHEYLCKLHELRLHFFDNLEQECTNLRDEFIANVDPTFRSKIRNKIASFYFI